MANTDNYYLAKRVQQLLLILSPFREIADVVVATSKTHELLAILMYDLFEALRKVILPV